MHADISQLIALRDGEPTDAAVVEHVRNCEACRRALAQYRQLASALCDLPVLSLPADSWSLVAERWQLERAAQRSRRPSARKAAVAASLVASLALALAGGIFLKEPRGPDPSAASVADESTANLQRRSRELEYLLQRYEAPVVMSLRTAGAISELEDGIAVIDHRLNAGGDEKRERDLWRQRVELMETLVTVRAAETYSDSI